MENNKNVLRYASCACFGICLLIELIDFIGYLRDAFRYYFSFNQFMTYVFSIAAFALIIAAIITSKQMLLVAGGAVGMLSALVSTFSYFTDPYFEHRIFMTLIQVIWLVIWNQIILIGVKGEQNGKTLGITGGVLVVINRIAIMVFNQLTFGYSHFLPQFYLYSICFIAGLVMLGLTVDSFHSVGSAAFGASGQYGTGAPNRQYRQYRRYDASAPGGEAGQQNYQAPGGGSGSYNYQAPGRGSGSYNYQAPGGGAAPYNYQAPRGGSGQQNNQGSGGWAPQNYQRPGGGPAPYNYQRPGGGSDGDSSQ